MLVIVLFALFTFFLSLFAHLYEIQEIEIADTIWTVAWISSLGLGIVSGIIGYKQIRKHYILLGAPIILGILATSIGGLSGAIFFKTLSYLIGFN